MYVESAKTRQARNARSSRVLEFARTENGRRVVPYLTLDPPEPEEAAWVGRYLELADRALDNQGRELDRPSRRMGPLLPVRRRA